MKLAVVFTQRSPTHPLYGLRICVVDHFKINHTPIIITDEQGNSKSTGVKVTGVFTPYQFNPTDAIKHANMINGYFREANAKPVPLKAGQELCIQMAGWYAGTIPKPKVERD